ncbi:MAG: hypothetical protein ACI8P3_002706 [Saprospiraceae bacterium]|jgi:hypothetical protein
MKKILILGFLFCATFAYSHDDPIKWEKISQQEIGLTVVEFDSSATAVVLCDNGQIFAHRGDGVIFRRHDQGRIDYRVFLFRRI